MKNDYPRGLTREQMSWQARMMGIADIFEALTAEDRPYKKGKPLTESLTILVKLKLNGHIDPDLFDVFVREKVYLTYAQQFLDPEQIDEVDVSKIPGYQDTERETSAIPQNIPVTAGQLRIAQNNFDAEMNFTTSMIPNTPEFQYR
jgi:hypothetical protein